MKVRSQMMVSSIRLLASYIYQSHHKMWMMQVDWGDKSLLFHSLIKAQKYPPVFLFILPFFMTVFQQMIPVCIFSKKTITHFLCLYLDIYIDRHWSQLLRTWPSINKLVPLHFCLVSSFSCYLCIVQLQRNGSNYTSLCDKYTHALSLGVKYGETELKMGSVASYFGQLCGQEKKTGEIWCLQTAH